MKVLRFAIFLLAVLGVGAVSGDDALYDFEQLTTENGKVYRSIFVLGSDSHGLLFRHEEGIAKIDFEQLSMSLRMLYEPVESPPVEPFPAEGEAADRKDAGAEAETGQSASASSAGVDWLRGATVTLTARNRVSVPWRAYGTFCGTACGPLRHSWPQHWPRYQPALRLAIPSCRAAAVEDFLITTGLVPRPPGVNTYRLPYNRADLLH